MHRNPIGEPRLDDPAWRQRNPYQTFLLLLLFLSGVPLVWGQADQSDVINQAVPHIAVVLWGLCLLVGSVAGAVGSLLPSHHWETTWTLLITEMAGMLLVGGGALIYALVISETSPEHLAGVRFIVALTVAFGLSSWWRVVQIIVRLIWIRKAVLRAHE